MTRAELVYQHYLELVEADKNTLVHRGGVAFHAVQLTPDNVAVRIWTQPGQEPDYVISNPPTLVPDPSGDIDVRGQRHRADPLGAVAAVIQENRR